MNTLEDQTEHSPDPILGSEYQAKLERYFQLFQQGSACSSPRYPSASLSPCSSQNPTKKALSATEGKQTSIEQQADQVADLIAHEIIFKDPFQQIQGTEAFCKLLKHFHHNVQNACFEIEAVCPLPNHQAFSQDHNTNSGQNKKTGLNSGNEIKWLVKWHFSGQLQGIGDWQFPGVSEITQDSQGRISHHIDYWDASEHFYSKLPILGRILNWLKNRIARASQA
ncbi:MAG: hypothetical protein CMI12_09905 [Oceanospirillum sp.]|nr:hypothetical protein [Oceanospirillum sp.]